MRVGLYMVFDGKVQGYSMPFASQSDQAAVRTFTDALKQGDSLMSRHPEDFSLVRLADFDDVTGMVTPVQPGPLEVFHGRNLKKEEV